MTGASGRRALFRRARLPNARIYQQLRTAHLERAHSQTPASILYVERSYDFASELAVGLDLIQTGTFGAPLVVLRSRLRIIEVNEPLVRQRLLRTVAAVVAARATARVHRLPVEIVSHAIENRDPFGGAGAGSFKSRLRLALDRSLSRRLARSLDRISFGTDAAEELYRSLLGRQLRSAQAELFRELPAPCDCVDLPRVPRSVAFLGAFDERKGVRELLAAWPTVIRAVPDATLTLMGKGPLTDEVLRAAAELAGVTVIVDPSRAEIHRQLRQSSVLALLSRPRPRWREQVGLPIVEALSHGCTIVTTEQTGLASWLSAHGHVVVDSGDAASTVGEAISHALFAARPAPDVLKDLPEVDGRTAADGWLFGAGRSEVDPTAKEALA